MRLALVVDASVGLKWVLQEPDSHLADALTRSGENLLVPDFWLNEATNVLWLQVRRKLLTPSEAREGLALLQAQLAPTPTADMGLHEVAMDIGLAVSHSTYDTQLSIATVAEAGGPTPGFGQGQCSALLGAPKGRRRLAEVVERGGVRNHKRLPGVAGVLWAAETDVRSVRFPSGN